MLDVIFRTSTSIALAAAGHPITWLTPADPSQVPDPDSAPPGLENEAAGDGNPGNAAEQGQGRVVVNASGLTLLRRLSALEARVYMMTPGTRLHPDRFKNAIEESEDSPYRDMEQRMTTLEESVELLAHNWIRRERSVRRDMEMAIKRVEGVRNEMERRFDEEVRKVEEMGQDAMSIMDNARLDARGWCAVLDERVARMEKERAEAMERKEEKAPKILTKSNKLKGQMEKELLCGSEDGGVEGSAKAEQGMGKTTENEREGKGKGKGKWKGKGKK